MRAYGGRGEHDRPGEEITGCNAYLPGHHIGSYDRVAIDLLAGDESIAFRGSTYLHTQRFRLAKRLGDRRSAGRFPLHAMRGGQRVK
jgi:hypothetical protein